MQKYVGEKRYRIGQMFFGAWEFVRHQPIFLYLVLIGLVAVMAGVVNRDVSVLALFDGDGVFTVKEVVAQEDDSNVPQPTETFVVQAEGFVGSGGENESSEDATSTKTPASATDGNNVTVEPSQDEGGGNAIGGLDDGEWLAYTYTVPRTSTYDVLVRLARQDWDNKGDAYFRVEVDGKNISGKQALPDTGGWYDWVTISAGQATLNAGSHKVVLRMIDNDGRTGLLNFNWFQFVPPNDVPIPPKDIPTPPPDTSDPAPDPTPDPAPDPEPDPGPAKSFYLEAEDYETYYDTSPGNDGGAYNRDDDVDIEVTEDVGGGYNVGYIDDGEWLKYDFSVSTETIYTVLTRVARSQHDDTTNTYFQIYIDGRRVGGKQAVGDTGGWQSWSTTNSGTIKLSAGDHVFEYKALDNSLSYGLMNINWFKLVPEGQDLDVPPNTPPPEDNPTPPPEDDPTPPPEDNPTPSPPAPTPPPPNTGNKTPSGPISISGQSNVVIENMSFTDIADQAIYLNEVSGITIRNNDFIRVEDAILCHRCTGPIVIENNYAQDLNHVEGRGFSQFIQFDKVSGPGIVIRNNTVDGGITEDIISIYQSQGTESSPILITRNRLRGCRPGGACWESEYGSGIMTGDIGGANTRVYENLMVDAGQVGVGISGGTNISAERNIIYGPAKTFTNVGIFVWDWQGGSAGPCYGHTVTDNLVRFYKPSGSSSNFWNGSNCGSINMSGNVWPDNRLDYSLWDMSWSQLLDLLP